MNQGTQVRINSMKTINVLVLGIGGNTSFGIIKALKKSNLPLRLFGACIDDGNVGHLIVDDFYISPYANSPSFIGWLINLCQDKEIDIVFTGVEEILMTIAINNLLIQKLKKTVFMVSNIEFLEIAQDKFKTVEWLKNNGFSFPHYCKTNSIDELDLFLLNYSPPYIIKPIRGKSSKGIEIIHDHDGLKSYIGKGNYVLQQYIGSDEEEYTVGCYVGRNGFVFEPIIMRRKLNNGNTVFAEIVFNQQIKTYCMNICKKFGSTGPLNIQLRLDNDKNPVCFEINLRYSGTTPIRAEFGFNDVVAAIKENVLSMTIADEFNITSGYSIRYSSELYVKRGKFVGSKDAIKLENLGLDNENINNRF